MPPTTSVWVCQSWKYRPQDFETKHVFKEDTENGFCPACSELHRIGILKEEEGVPELTVNITFPAKNQKFKEGDNITISADVSPESDVSKVEFFVDDKLVGKDDVTPYTYTYYATKGPHLIYAKAYTNEGETATSEQVAIDVKQEVLPEVGLSIILMDASESMGELVFEGSKVTKLRLVATTAASGIFDLERLQSNPYAIVAAFKFDDRLEPMFIDSVANLINRFDRNVNKFADYIYDELNKMLRGTDINQALMHAHSFVDKFLRKQLPDFPVDRYRVMIQRLMRYKTNVGVSIPNIRVLLYTDGRQFDRKGNTELNPNPFKEYPIENLNHDIVIGAFFGKETDPGCNELQGLLSKCPLHDELQFFLFDDPAKIANLQYLFRMASGASGFCPSCLEKEIR